MIPITSALFQSDDPDDAGALRPLPLVPARLNKDGSCLMLGPDSLYGLSHFSKLVTTLKVFLEWKTVLMNVNMFLHSYS